MLLIKIVDSDEMFVMMIIVILHLHNNTHIQQEFNERGTLNHLPGVVTSDTHNPYPGIGRCYQKFIVVAIKPDINNSKLYYGSHAVGCHGILNDAAT